MRKLMIAASFLLLINGTVSAELTGEQILKKVDEQMLTKTAYSEADMIIHISDSTDRKLEFKSYSKGREFSLIEFTAPAREKGTKFLRREKTMWLYFPRADRIRQIKGHMLKQGMMGSDFSYEDASEVESVYDHYDSTLLGSEKYRDRDVYVIELIAKDTEVSYHKRKIWVDKKWFVPLKEELYAKSGLLLKEMQLWDVKQINGHYYPTYWKMINKLTNESSTEMIMKKLEIDVPIRDDVFSLSNLKKR